MSISHWLLAMLFGLIAIETLAVVAAHWWADEDGADAEPRGEDGVVECPDCGTDNDYGYRYCRSCVAELPGAPSMNRGTPSPLGGFAR